MVLVRDGDPAYVARIEREAAPATVMRLPRWLSGAFERVGCWRAARLFRPDVIHTHLGRATSRVVRAGGKVPHVATLHIEWRRPYARCDGVICIASWQKATMPAAFKRRVDVIWNSIAPPPPVGNALAQRPSGKVAYLSVGRLVPNKGMDVLIRAFRLAFPDLSAPVTLTIAGDGPELGRLRELAAGDGRISLLGYVDDVRPLYQAAHVYVSAARIEPFGLTILEAMQAGCHLVCTRTDGPMEFLAHQAPEWTEIDDIERLAGALKRHGMPPLAPRAWNMADFAPAHAAQRIEAFYRDCIADRAAQ